MQALVEFAVPAELTSGDGPTHEQDDLVEFAGLLVGDGCGRAGRDQALQHHPYLGDLDCLIEGYLANVGTLVAPHLDEALRREVGQCGPDREPARPEPLTQGRLNQPFSREVVTLEDRGPQRHSDRIVEG